MFQKMSDDELERRTRDAEARRREIVLGKNTPATEEESLHPTTDKDFNQRFGGSLYQEDNNPTLEQPGNVQVERRRYNSNKKKRDKVGLYQDETNASQEENTTSNFLLTLRKNINSTKSRSANNQDKEGATEKALDIYGSTVGRGLITSAYAWTNFIYLTVQIWLGIIAAIAIGLVFAIEFYVGAGITQEAFNALMTTIGVDWDFYLVATLCYMLVVAVCYFQLFGVAIQAKALGLHPLGGEGAFFKTGTFLLCFIFYWVPIVNCLPLVNFYTLSIQAYPR